MLKRVYQFVCAAVMLLALIMPLVECFDGWDGPATVPLNDTEFRLMVVFVGIGVLLTLGQLVHGLLTAGDVVFCGLRPLLCAAESVSTCHLRVSAAASPPLIPLRI